MGYDKLQLNFNYPMIPFKEVRSEHGVKLNKDTKAYLLLQKRTSSDRTLAHIADRLGWKANGFTANIIHDEKPAPTLCAGGGCYRMCDGEACSDADYRNIQTFPQDYDFTGVTPAYLCGMSVPPNMMAHIATEIWNQWLSKEEKNG